MGEKWHRKGALGGSVRASVALEQNLIYKSS